MKVLFTLNQIFFSLFLFGRWWIQTKHLYRYMVFAGQLYCSDKHSYHKRMQSIVVCVSMVSYGDKNAAWLPGWSRPALSLTTVASAQWTCSPAHVAHSRDNCHRALCDQECKLPTDPNHLLGRKSLSLTPCCQHLPVDTLFPPVSFYFLSLPHPASHSWCLARDALIKSSCKAIWVFMKYVKVTTVILKQQAMDSMVTVILLLSCK